MMVATLAHKDKGQVERNWDVICVGAGISSLAFAAQLTKLSPDCRILVIDKHYAPGGYATVFYRRKKRFDCSLHKLSGMGKGGNLAEIMRGLDLFNEIEPVVSNDYFNISARGYSCELANDYGKTKAQLEKIFPEEKEALREFFAEVDVHGRNGYYQLQMLDGSFEPNISELRFAHRHLKNITVADALSKRFLSPLLREILAAPGIYVGGFPEDLGYLYYLHVVYATLVCGNAYVKGSSQLLSNTLAKRIEEGGGKILLKTEVNKIITDKCGNALGVETTQGRFFASEIIVNVSPHYAAEHFFDEKIDMQDARLKLKNLKPSRSTTTLYGVTDAAPEALGLTSAETMVFSPFYSEARVLRKAAAQNPKDSVLAERAYWKASTMEVTNYHKLDAEGGYVFCLNVLDNIAQWPARGTAEYKEKKARAAEVLTQRLIDAYPGLTGHIRFCEISSPRTYERYTANTDGAGYGAMVGTDLSGHTFHYKFPVAGVHFLSAWVAGPSYEAAFGYAVMKAKQFSAARNQTIKQRGAL